MLFLAFLACIEDRLTTNCQELVAEQNPDCGTQVFSSADLCASSGCTEAEVDNLLEWAWCQNDVCVGDTGAGPCDFPDVSGTCSASQP